MLMITMMMLIMRILPQLCGSLKAAKKIGCFLKEQGMGHPEGGREIFMHVLI
jgi:hypothetical protein